ncbi:MAG: hypothetical protein MK171_12055 [Pirellulales bacterium]|nr:hypothetical protein [Pirellulales bacterium]
MYRGHQEIFDVVAVDWLEIDAAGQEIALVRLPAAEDIPLSAEVGMVVELLLR